MEGAVVKEVIGLESAGQNLLKPDAWKPVDDGYTPEAGTISCDNGTSAKTRRGACQTLVLNQTSPNPIFAAAWSKAAGVAGGRDNDYSLYLDLTYADGENQWGVTSQFHTGTHDWERRETVYYPSKPVRQLNYYLLLRRHPGKAWFRDPELRQIESPSAAVWFDGLPVIPKSAAGGFQTRDVAAGSSVNRFENGKTLDLKMDVKETKKGSATFFSGRIEDTAGKDRAVTLYYTVPVGEGDWRWLADPRTEVKTQPREEYCSAAHFGVGANGRLSKYPLAAVASGNRGLAIAMDMDAAAFFRVGYSAGTRELFIAYDFGLAPERNHAEFRFCVFHYDATWGFRAVLAEFYRLFPDQFRCRTPKQGLWMPFHSISEVKGWEDFGFKFKEGNDETMWDDAHGMITFRYTEPQTWWMSMPPAMPRTMEAALGEAKRLADSGDRSARALLSSGYHDENGRFPARLLDTPWTNGAVWSVNSSPAVPGDATDFKNKWNPRIRDELYGPNRKGDLDGEYVDSAEAYVTDELDYRREHFADSPSPLTFSFETRRPAIFKGLIVYEYVRALASDVRGMGKLMMANSTPDQLCWLTPSLDVMGTETDWNPDGEWRPMSDKDLLYRRGLCGPKPYCFLMNTDFDRFSHALVAKYMKRCLAYGMFPGFFSHNASEGHYFSRLDLYDRDRPLFKKYVPLCKLVAEAGWQPVTRARSSDPKVYVERFGGKYLTVFNDTSEKKAVVIAIESPASIGSCHELLSDTVLPCRNGKIEMTLESEDVAVLDLGE